MRKKYVTVPRKLLLTAVAVLAGVAGTLSAVAPAQAANWAVSTSTSFYSTNWTHVICFPGWSYGLGSIWAHNRCYAG